MNFIRIRRLFNAILYFSNQSPARYNMAVGLLCADLYPSALCQITDEHKVIYKCIIDLLVYFLFSAIALHLPNPEVYLYLTSNQLNLEFL